MAGKDVATMKISPKVWRNGEIINWEDARIHVMSHVVNYGSSVFEGIRCYNTTQGSAVFRLPEHIQRLMNSAKIYRMDPAFNRDQIIDATVELIRQSAAPFPECVIEFESAGGGKMRIQWKAAAPPDWAGLLRAWHETEG